MTKVICAFNVVIITLFNVARAPEGFSQVAPGPYEILPFEEAFIIEAFKDLDATAGRADWTGWSGTTWVSPNAYNNHTGTDFSVQTGTPLYASAPGVVKNVVSIYPRDEHNTATGLGNFVQIALDSPGPNGEWIDLYYAHMLTVTVTNGQRVAAGDPVGLSDNTGNSKLFDASIISCSNSRIVSVTSMFPAASLSTIAALRFALV